MLIIKFSEAEVKEFMNKLIKEDTFDMFETRGVEISTFTKIEFSGTLEKSLAEEKNRNYCTWQELKPYIFNILKKNKRPKAIKIIFSYREKEISTFNENAKTLFLNIVYDNNTILCTTAVSTVNFTMDKSLDILWDEYMFNFFKNIGIVFTTS